MLATADTFAGMVPCKAISWFQDGPLLMVRVLCTATRGCYHRGDTETFMARKVYPRNKWRRSRRGPSWIVVEPYDWQASLPQASPGQPGHHQS